MTANLIQAQYVLPIPDWPKSGQERIGPAHRKISILKQVRHQSENLPGKKKKLIEINLDHHLYLDDIFKTLDMESALR